MIFSKTTELSHFEKKQIHDLWNKEYPKKLVHPTLADFENYLDNLIEQSHILLTDKNHNIYGWYFDFKRENEKWFAIIINSEYHGKGFGTRLLNLAKQKEDELNGWVIETNKEKKQNGKFYKSPLNFYLKNDFKLLEDVRLELEALSAVKIKWIK